MKVNMISTPSGNSPIFDRFFDPSRYVVFPLLLNWKVALVDFEASMVATIWFKHHGKEIRYYLHYEPEAYNLSLPHRALLAFMAAELVEKRVTALSIPLDGKPLHEMNPSPSIQFYREIQKRVGNLFTFHITEQEFRELGCEVPRWI